jgi:hypothetical protein
LQCPVVLCATYFGFSWKPSSGIIKILVERAFDIIKFEMIVCSLFEEPKMEFPDPTYLSCAFILK